MPLLLASLAPHSAEASYKTHLHPCLPHMVSIHSLTQRLAENANMLMDVLESRNKLLNSIEIK